MELYTLTPKGLILSHSPNRETDPKKQHMKAMIYFLAKAHVTVKDKIVSAGSGDYAAWASLISQGIIQKAG